MRADKELYPLLKAWDNEKYNTEVIFQTIDGCMKELESLKDVYGILDYGNPYFQSTVLDRDAEYTLCSHVNIGGSEGIYMDVYLTDVNKNLIRLGTYKTLEDDLNASILMGKLAGAFEFLFELYYMVNF